MNKKYEVTIKDLNAFRSGEPKAYRIADSVINGTKLEKKDNNYFSSFVDYDEGYANVVLNRGDEPFEFVFTLKEVLDITEDEEHIYTASACEKLIKLGDKVGRKNDKEDCE